MLQSSTTYTRYSAAAAEAAAAGFFRVQDCGYYL